MSHPVPTSTWLRRASAPLAVVAVAAGGVIAVRVRSPFVPGSWGMCPWLILTGRPCPTCGGLRCLAALSQADLALAWSLNAYLTASALAAGVAWLGWLGLRLWATPAHGWQRHVAPMMVAVWGWSTGLVAFGLVRWLSWPSG